MKRLTALALGLLLAFLGARLLYTQLAREETKIRWMVEDMVEGFNGGKARKSISGLDQDWSHAGRPLDREMIRGFILREAMQGGLGNRRKYPWMVELPEDSLVIQVAEGNRAANLETEIQFFHKRGGGTDNVEWELQWHLKLKAELHMTDDGWRILTSQHEDIHGALIGG